MYSTQHTWCNAAPSFMGCITHKFCCYPLSTAQRQLEGGLRLQAKYKKSMPQKPLVTVITVTKNRSHSLHKALLSVLTQSYDNIEYIVIDGASSDTTPLLLMTYGDAIDYYLSEEDAGLYDAMNKGISLASGEYIIILNDDDWYYPNAIECLVQASLKNERKMTCALTNMVNAEGVNVGTIPHFPYSGFVFFRAPLRHELMLMPAHAYETVGYYDTQYAIIADLKCMQKLYALQVPLVMLDTPLMSFSTTGVSHHMENLQSERKKLLLENFPFLEEKDVDFLATMLFNQHVQCYRLLEKYKKFKKFTLALTDYLRACTFNFLYMDPK